MKAAQVTPRKYGGKSAEQRRAERRTQLVDAALEIWQEQGWAAVTMRGVCARAGLTDRYFYENFTDRDALLVTIWDQMRDETLEMLLSAILPVADQSAMVQLRAAIYAVVHHIADEPTRAQIIFGDHAGSAVLEQRRRDTIQMSTDLLIELGKSFMREGTDDQALRVNVVLGIGGFVELMLAWQNGLVEGDTDAMIDHITALSGALGAPFLTDGAGD